MKSAKRTTYSLPECSGIGITRSIAIRVVIALPVVIPRKSPVWRVHCACQTAWSRAPGADSVGVDANEGRWTGDGFSGACDFYRPRVEAGTWREAVDHDCCFPGTCDVAELLRGVHLAAGDVEGAEFGVEAVRNRSSVSLSAVLSVIAPPQCWRAAPRRGRPSRFHP